MTTAQRHKFGQCKAALLAQVEALGALAEMRERPQTITAEVYSVALYHLRQLGAILGVPATQNPGE